MFAKVNQNAKSTENSAVHYFNFILIKSPVWTYVQHYKHSYIFHTNVYLTKSSVTSYLLLLYIIHDPPARCTHIIYEIEHHYIVPLKVYIIESCSLP